MGPRAWPWGLHWHDEHRSGRRTAPIRAAPAWSLPAAMERSETARVCGTAATPGAAAHGRATGERFVRCLNFLPIEWWPGAAGFWRTARDRGRGGTFSRDRPEQNHRCFTESAEDTNDRNQHNHRGDPSAYWPGASRPSPGQQYQGYFHSQEHRQPGRRPHCGSARQAVGLQALDMRGTLGRKLLGLYDNFGYIRVLPERGSARTGGVYVPKQSEQFDAVAYSDGQGRHRRN